MMKGRMVRSLSRRMSAGKIIDASGQDQSYRSRAAEIMMETAERVALLEKNHRVVYDHITANYSVYLTKYKTKGEREQAVDSLLYEVKDILGTLRLVDKLATILITDIDKASWSLERALERWKMANKKEVSM
jgi:hypothetical protein